jgi:hypothetical protein
MQIYIAQAFDLIFSPQLMPHILICINSNPAAAAAAAADVHVDQAETPL